jgi:hypothetical protein
MCVNVHVLLEVTLWSTRFEDGSSNFFFFLAKSETPIPTEAQVPLTVIYRCHVLTLFLIVPMIHTPA